MRASGRGRRRLSHRILLAKYQNIDFVAWEGRFNSLFGFTALKTSERRLMSGFSLPQRGTPSCPLDLS